jgi:hypothetical protein
MPCCHSWASASRLMPPTSAFRHPLSQSGTGLGPHMPVLDWFRHRHFCSFRYRTDWMPDSPAFKKGVHIARPYCLCWWWYSKRNAHAVHVQTAGSKVMVLFLLYDIEKSYVNAGMSECRRKVSPASAFLPVVSCLRPASVFRHQGSVRYRWSRISPALPSSDFCRSSHIRQSTIKS